MLTGASLKNYSIHFPKHILLIYYFICSTNERIRKTSNNWKPLSWTWWCLIKEDFHTLAGSIYSASISSKLLSNKTWWYKKNSTWIQVILNIEFCFKEKDNIFTQCNQIKFNSPFKGICYYIIKIKVKLFSGIPFNLRAFTFFNI